MTVKINFNKLPNQFRGTDIYEQANQLAYAYQTKNAAADADGAPNSYSPADLGKACDAPHVGLDCLQNAGYDPKQSWWKDVLVPDPNNPNNAYVQQSGPGKGFYLSATALHKTPLSKPDTYQSTSYVDATQFPYVVIPTGFGAFYPNSAKPGDVGFATYLDTGATTTFVVGDAGGGPKATLGEASIALFARLGFPNADPRNGHGLPTGNIQYILFPRSGSKVPAIWPRTNQDIHDQVIGLLKNTPGIDYEEPVAAAELAAQGARVGAAGTPAKKAAKRVAAAGAPPKKAKAKTKAKTKRTARNSRLRLKVKAKAKRRSKARRHAGRSKRRKTKARV